MKWYGKGRDRKSEDSVLPAQDVINNVLRRCTDFANANSWVHFCSTLSPRDGLILVFSWKKASEEELGRLRAFYNANLKMPLVVETGRKTMVFIIKRKHPLEG